MGVHLTLSSDRSLRELAGQMPKLAAVGINAIIIEVNYSFDFKSVSELAGGGITAGEARKLAAACREQHVRLIPGFNCLGHQSWKQTTFALLAKHPELDETPGQYPDNKEIYCRSWCPRHPKIGQIVFPLLDELTDAFESDAIHVGMDEVFIVSSEFCPRCKGTDPAGSYAKAVNDIHEHVVDKRKLTMMMWGDRLLDGKAMKYGEWEASDNATFPAIDKIPNDIVICDWHYEKRREYPSVPLFVKKGFRVWPSSWKSETNALALREYAKTIASDKMVGQLFTTWGYVKVEGLAAWPPITAVLGNAAPRDK